MKELLLPNYSGLGTIVIVEALDYMELSWLLFG